jgi:hypothetical protein
MRQLEDRQSSATSQSANAESAYQLYAGLSKDIRMKKNEYYVIPWGRISTCLRGVLVNVMKLPEEGGTGMVCEFWSFYEELMGFINDAAFIRFLGFYILSVANFHALLERATYRVR